MTTKSSNNNTVVQNSALREALPQVIAVCVKNVLLLAFGMTLGYPTILIPSFSGDDGAFRLSPEQISWIGSINLICVPVGGMVSGGFTQLFGRKRTMQMVNIPFLAAWLLFYFSRSIWQVFLALSVTGLSGGLLEAPVLTYVAEITQPHLRGMLSSTSTMSVIIGVTIQFFLGTFFAWRTVAMINVVVPITAFVLLFFVPESPHWLVAKNRFHEARKGIAWLRGWRNVQEIEGEFQELCRHLGKHCPTGIDNPAFTEPPPMVKSPEPTSNVTSILQSKLATFKLFSKKTFIIPYALVSMAFFLGHFGGMTTLQTYAVQIFAAFHTPIDKYYATIILGIAELIGCIASVSLIHYTGKRTLNFASLLASGLCFAVVATYAFANDVNYLLTDEEEASGNSTNGTRGLLPKSFEGQNWIPPTFLIASAFVSHFGIRILPWILTGEVFTNDTRAAASGFSSAIGYVFGFAANKVFLSMISAMTLPGTFWFYSGVSFLGTVLMYFWLPETEGKSLHDITEHFAGRRRLSNKVHRKKIDLEGDVNKGYESTEMKMKRESLRFESKL